MILAEKNPFKFWKYVFVYSIHSVYIDFIWMTVAAICFSLLVVFCSYTGCQLFSRRNSIWGWLQVSTRTGKAYQCKWYVCTLVVLVPQMDQKFFDEKSPLYLPKPNPKLTFLVQGKVCDFSPLLSLCWTDRGALEKVLILQPFWWACWPVGAASCRDQSPLGSLSCH